MTPFLRHHPQQDAEKGRQLRSRIAQRLNVRLRVRFASLLAVALLDGLFDHPADSLHIVCDFAPSVFSETPKHFSTTCQLG
jgi:hypothetical protein